MTPTQLSVTVGGVVLIAALALPFGMAWFWAAAMWLVVTIRRGNRGPGDHIHGTG